MTDDPAQSKHHRKRGRPKKNEQKGVNHTFTRGTGNRDYTIARLEACGRADLVDRILKREISAYAASIMMGWAKRRKTVCEPGDHNKSRRLAFDIRSLIG
jgi:hypothetical protein